MKRLIFIITIALALFLFVGCGTSQTPADSSAESLAGTDNTVTTDTETAHEHTPETVPGKDATCTETGLTEGEHCSVCGEILIAQEEIPTAEHEIIAVEPMFPTCTEDGYTPFEQCAVCGGVLSESEVIEKTGHTPEIIPGKDATCIETGLTEGEKCSVCGEILKVQTEVAKTEHTVVTVPKDPATCLEEGKTAWEYCSVCSTHFSEPQVIEKREHSPAKLSAIAATCTSAGKTEGSYCSACSLLLKEQKTIEKLTHDFVNGKCSLCGTSENPVDEPAVEEAPVEEAEPVRDTNYPLDKLTTESIFAKNYNILKFLKKTDETKIPMDGSYTRLLNDGEKVYKGTTDVFGVKGALYVAATSETITYISFYADAGYLSRSQIPFTDALADKQVNNTMKIVNAIMGTLDKSPSHTYEVQQEFYLLNQPIGTGGTWITEAINFSDIESLVRLSYPTKEGVSMDHHKIMINGRYKTDYGTFNYQMNIDHSQYGTFAAKFGHVVVLNIH